MQIKVVLTGYLILVLILLPVLAISVSSQDPSPPFWNQNWSHRQEIKLPISTDNALARYQTIDLRVQFDKSCWAKNEDEHCIRVCCWDVNNWHELESQIYDLDFIDSNHIEECSVVFLVPKIANGNEKYYVYYDDNEKSAPNYKDHVSVEDSYYSSRLIADISAELTYYGIKEDGYSLYGVGQSGQLLDQSFSQVIVKQKPGMRTFDVFSLDQITSFSFSYYYGSKEEQEISSDESFVSKKIFVDGNLMVEFGIISESSEGELRTTVVYKYYYNPHEDKRICVHVKHEVLDESVVRGKENLDGRYGSLISFKSRNLAVDKLNFGDILPFLYFSGEDNVIEEYPMNMNPESNVREWIISFKDDADIGKESWIAYGGGKEGKSHAVIFSSNNGIVKSGTDERDGIQLKVAEREYLDFLGTEVDYASINFGRNSYEKGYSHDLIIPSDLVVEFDAEVFTSEDGGCQAVQQEVMTYKELVKHRHLSVDPSFEKEQKKYVLRVITRFGGTRFSFPWLANRTSVLFPVMWIEIYHDGNLVTSGTADRSFFPMARAHKTFHDLAAGTYLIKVYRKFSNSTMFFNGAKVVELHKNSKTYVFCTWQRTIQLTFSDQNGNAIEGISAYLFNSEDVIFASNITDGTGELTLKIPHSFKDTYRLKAYYKDFLICDDELKKTQRKLKLSFDIALYDLTVEIKDKLNLPPGVDIHPTLSSTEYNSTLHIIPIEIEPGRYLFEDIPSGKYKLQISYASFLDEQYVDIPDDGNFVSITSSATFNLDIDLFDLSGSPLLDENIYFKIFRDGKEIYESLEDELSFTLPPAQYIVKVYQSGKLVGLKEVDLTSDRTIKILTTLSSILPTLIVNASIVLIGVLIVLALFKKISLASLLKFLAIALIIIALIQPWWVLSGSSSMPDAKRNTEMYLQPQVMIESTTYGGKTSVDLEAMPDVFVEFLGKLVIAAYMICILLFLSFIVNKLGKRNYSIVLVMLCALLLLAVIGMYYTGTAKLSEASIGTIQGEGVISFDVNGESLVLSSSWGLSTGFYLVVISFIFTILASALEFKSIFLGKRNS